MQSAFYIYMEILDIRRGKCYNKDMERVEKKQTNVWKKIGVFLDKQYAFFFAPIIVGCIYLFALWQYGVYPFGDLYTAASYDLSAQICPFIEHLFDVFDGKSTLTFSYAIVGGADVTGTFLYFFISPFSFLFLIFGDGKVAHASSIVMLCKLMAISVAGTWFAKKLFKGIPDYICLVIGVVYAYCGYTFVSNTYINWMDFLIYLPFCTGAFKHFVKTGKFLPFSLLVACCIYTCFSIACFSLFTVFPALVAYGLFCVEKEKKNKFIAYLCLSFFVALCISLPVLFPTLGAYSVSGRGGTLFENLWKGFSVDSATGALGAFSSGVFIDSYSESLYRKWSYILSDSAFVVLTLVWLWRKGIKDNFAKFMIVAGVLTLLPTVVDESMNLLNMGSYMSYALRFGFLNALYFLGGACLCIEGFCYKPLTAYDGASILTEGGTEAISGSKKGSRYALKSIFQAKNTKKLLWFAGFIVLAVVAAVALMWFTDFNNRRDFLSLFLMDSTDTTTSASNSNANIGNVAGSFAHSLGGFEVIVVFFLVVALVIVVGCFLVSAKKISPRLLSILLIFVVGVQIFFYNGQLVIGNRSTQHEALGHYQVLNEELNSRNDGYFRVKEYNDKMTACAPFTGNCNSFSVFSSVIDKDNFVTMELFGYSGNGKNSFKSAHNTNKGNRSDEFGDSFLGYKYFISNNKGLSKSYLKPVPALDEQGNVLLNEEGEEVQLSLGGYYVYENTIVFPMGYKVKQDAFSFVAPNTNNRTNRKQNQQALYAYLRGEELWDKWHSEFVTPEIATELSSYLHTKAAEVKVSAGKITARVTAEKGESLLLNFVAARGYSVTVNGKKTALVENDLKFLQVELEEGENEVVFTYSSPYVKYMAAGVGVGIVLLVAVAFVVKRTSVVEKLAPVLSWASIVVAIAVVAFFMLYPTGVFLSKVIELAKGALL